MTGGQKHDGQLTPRMIAQQVRAEGVIVDGGPQAVQPALGDLFGDQDACHRLPYAHWAWQSN